MSDVAVVGQIMDVIVRPAERGITQSPSAQMSVWAQAFETWLSRLSANTGKAYRKAWDDILAYTGKQPWAMGKADVQRWAEDMKMRGLADCTRAQRIAGVSSFFEFVSGDYDIVLPDGRSQALHHGNPATGKRLRPKVSPYGKATFLGKESVKALLKSIKRNRLQGLRDYALFFGYLMTCRRNSEWRCLRWGDIEQDGEKVFYRWSGKGKKDQRFEMPTPVWEAIKDYLKAAKRWGLMAEGDYIFTALTNKAGRLPKVNAETFNPFGQPLSMREVGRLLKTYGKHAGLNTTKLKVHTLRHTGAHGRKDSGEDIVQISKDLAHSSLAVTTIYLDTTEGHVDDHWSKVQEWWGV